LNSIAVLYEDNHILALNKRVGVLVQGDETGDTPLVEKAKAYLKKKYAKPGNVFLGVVHRLDRPTSGVVVFAKTSKALTRLNEQFRNRSVTKKYWALVSACFPEQKGTLTHWMRRNRQQNKSYAHTKEVAHSKKAVLHFKKQAVSDYYALLEIEIETGRHHQIRTQLSAIGYPIKGDLKYGAKRSNADGGICLHAHRLRFLHPVKKEEISLTATTPDTNLWNAFPFGLKE